MKITLTSIIQYSADYDKGHDNELLLLEAHVTLCVLPDPGS